MHAQKQRYWANAFPNNNKKKHNRARHYRQDLNNFFQTWIYTFCKTFGYIVIDFID